jgi:hypothetical protein
MTKNSKRNMLFLSSFLTILLIASAYAALMPNAHAAETTTSQKGLSTLTDVVGLDLAKYDVTTEEYSQSNSLLYLNVVPQENVIYDLTSEDSKLKALYTFAEGNLQMIQVLEREGSPSLFKHTSKTTDVELAKEFLSNYQTYAANPLFGKLKSTLDDVDAIKNLTKTSGNTVLEVITEDGYTNFKWYYTANGAVAPYSKFITLSFEDGFLAAFVDNWQLYDVGSTSISLSKEEAITIALEVAKAHSWSLKLDDDALDTKNFNESNVCWTTLILDSSLDADKTRNEDPLALYPVWRVGIQLNKWYGNLYGIRVDIWADTEQVRYVQEAWSTSDPPEGVPTADIDDQVSVSEATLNMIIVLPTIATAAVGTSLFWMRRKKKVVGHNLLKPRFLKTGGILLCILISSTLVLGTVATVNATSRGAVVWGSESTGAGDYPSSWRKSYTEINWQRNTAGNLSEYFIYGGYTGNNGINHQGIRNPGSEKYQIYNDVYALKTNNDYIAVVDFDHGVGGYPYSAPPGEQHYMFEDNTGTLIGTQGNYYTDWNHAVFDMDIYTWTEPGKVIFAYISACQSANIDRLGQGMLPSQWPPYPARALGMPFAWTQRLVADKSTTQDFTITQYISDDGYDDPDWGNQVYIGFPEGSASLEQGIPLGYGNPYSYWVCSFLGHAMYYDISVNDALDAASQQFLGCNFDNSELRNGFDAYWWGFPVSYDVNTLAVYGNGGIHLRYYTPPSDSASTPSVSGPAEGDIGVNYEFSAFSTNPYGHDIQYRFDWGDGSPYTETGWYADGATGYASHPWSSEGIFNVKVQARCPNSGWSSWSSPHTICIGDLPTLTVYAYNQYGYPGEVPLYIDDVCVGPTGYSYMVTPDEHDIYVYSPLYDGYGIHTFDYYYYDGNYNYNNPMTLSITSDKTVTAYYYSYYY